LKRASFIALLSLLICAFQGPGAAIGQEPKSSTADNRDDFQQALNNGNLLLRQGRIEDVVHIGIVAVHLLTFVEDIKRGRHEAAFYADTNLKPEPARKTVSAAA